MGRNQYWAGRVYDLGVYYMTGTPDIKTLKNKDLFALILSDVVFIMLINVKMATIVGILTFMSMIQFILRRVEHDENVYLKPLKMQLVQVYFFL